MTFHHSLDTRQCSCDQNHTQAEYIIENIFRELTAFRQIATSKYLNTNTMGKKNKNSLEQADRPAKRINPSEQTAFITVLFHCVLIIASPIATFFGSKFFIFDQLLDLSSIQSNIWSAVAAVVTLHLALGLYLYRAYFEVDNGPHANHKED